MRSYLCNSSNLFRESNRLLHSLLHVQHPHVVRSRSVRLRLGYKQWKESTPQMHLTSRDFITCNTNDRTLLSVASDQMSREPWSGENHSCRSTPARWFVAQIGSSSLFCPNHSFVLVLLSLKLKVLFNIGSKISFCTIPCDSSYIPLTIVQWLGNQSCSHLKSKRRVKKRPQDLDELNASELNAHTL